MKFNYHLLLWLGIFFSQPFTLLSQSVPQDILDINPNVLPESTYPFWPAYNYLEFSDVQNIEAQVWSKSDHTVMGWDWSLPENTVPATNSMIALQRNIYFKTDGSIKEFDAPNLKFEGNPVGLLWVKWRDIEKVDGEIDFSTVISSIEQANSQGVDIVLRILAHSKERGNGVEGEAPLWLEDLGASLLPRDKTSDNLNFDPSDPIFHEQYLQLVDALGKSGIPQMVKSAYVGYASHTFGDEGIGPHGEKEWEKNDAEVHVRERLDAWQHAFDGIEHKIFMGGTSHYGFNYGFGVRRGFVEMYLYNIPNLDMGQSIDADGYLILDENSPIVSHGGFHGEVNEEYEPAWATPERGYRFGATTNSFTYRYFMSNLRALQMRCNYIHTTGHLIPEMLPFIAQELGRSVEDTPDVWTYLGTSYMNHQTYKNNDNASPKRSFTKEEKNEGIEMKNFERWLYQRDAEGYTTTPEVQIQQSIKMWMVFEDKYYDYIARKGNKIGFDIDDRWMNDDRELAIKVTYFDNSNGQLQLVYNNENSSKSVDLTGDGKLKTTTFIINDLDENSMPQGFDFTLEAGGEATEITVSMVRVIDTNEDKDEIHGMSVPEKVTAGEQVTVAVDYLATENREMTVELKLNSTPWTTYGSKKVNVQEGEGTLDITFDVADDIIIADSAYKISAYLFPVGGNYGSRLSLKSLGDISAIAPVFIDSILSIIAPQQVKGGEVISSQIHFNTKENRELTVELKLNSAPWTTYGSQKVNLTNREGTVEVEFEVAEDILIANDAYKISAYVYPVGGNYNDRIHQLSITGIDAISSSITSNSSTLRSNNLIVYPNPFSNQIKIQASENFIIFDINERLVYESQNNQLSETINIDTSLWLNGMYFIKSVSGEVVKILKH
ncbi:T9SS type A sorting domain-containing protein [Flammeovirga yaeyamensis]|uniref:T9SS type A sorting domain-containing protein n=1 Tax=Flammeovirga yaeyamensis TaxID=367791 RepID=A0AAX1NC25_9BACT|nr:T9SS type A sorting domain-containing protein [Flammeovirga yaeyamensis]MBB3697000.1 hypothetical protein [Flammeovirga yaeyamensis]NMF33663.1 T9SS type A sorting domain-containing protein [Flammeovirga yaeyamensis]QWG05071.1 T9SS type A sorting domain-containing protein [Flammeovirga yaeyamensis]